MAVAAIGVAVGPTAVPLGDVARSLTHHLLPWWSQRPSIPAPTDAIVWDLRSPRVVLAGLVGGSLASAGATYQATLVNPLADPYLLGAASGAGLGATTALVLLDTPALLAPLAFLGATAGVLLAVAVGASTDPFRRPTSILLGGIATASCLTALQTFLLQQHSTALPRIYGWLLGQLRSAAWSDLAAVLPPTVLGMLLATLLGPRLQLLSLGDDKAATLGVHPTRTRMCALAAASMLTAAAVAVAGLVGFVGLIVPHIARRCGGQTGRPPVGLSFAMGATTLIVADLVARTALAPAELPVGVVTAAIGAPALVVVLRSTAGRAT